MNIINRITIIVLLFGTLSGCRIDVTTDIFLTDLKSVAKEKIKDFYAPAEFKLEMSTEKKCNEEKENIGMILNGYFDDIKVKNCISEGTNSFLLVSLVIPVIGVAQHETKKSIIGILSSYYSKSNTYQADIKINLDGLKLLNKKIKEKYYFDLDFKDSNIIFKFKNDGKSKEKINIQGSFVDGQPYVRYSYVEIGANKSMEIKFSNVKTSHFNKTGSTTVLWIPDPEKKP